MNHLGMTLDLWVKEIPSNRHMRIATGFHPSDDLPGIASLKYIDNDYIYTADYDFISKNYTVDEKT